MSSLDFLKYGLVHVAALFNVSGMFFRDQLLLRALILVSTLLYIVYYLIVPPTPLWDAIAWCVVLIGVNSVVMVLIALDRKAFRLTDPELRLFKSLLTFSPGEFRRLMKLARWQQAHEPQTLTVEGKPAEALFFVIDGTVDVYKQERSFSVPPGIFIGEIGFLLDRPASATVRLQAGARYVEWSREQLTLLLKKHPSLKTALEARLNIDLASKIAVA
jgi:hypothetical protein